MLKRIKKGDTVVCLAGKDKGRRGKVLRVLSDGEKIIVEKLNLKKRHRKPTREFQGGIIEMPAAIPSCRLLLVCPRCSKPTRSAFKVLEGGKKVRSCKKCQEIIDKV